MRVRVRVRVRVWTHWERALEQGRFKALERGNAHEGTNEGTNERTNEGTVEDC